MRRFAGPSRALSALFTFPVSNRAAGGSAFDDSPHTQSGKKNEHRFPSGGGVESSAATEVNTEAHPLLYNVPALSARTVGRDAEVTALWQNLLAGRRCQTLVGVDGIGKSTIASEFCDAARKSGRFTCIQWFNGQQALASQLERFFASMRGRRERDVLLVLDDVADPEAALAYLPAHKNVYVIITSNRADATQSAKMNVVPTLPLAPKAAEELAVEVDGANATDSVNAILDTLGFVPLLVNLASLLLAGAVMPPKDLLEALTRSEVMKDNTLSVSKALHVLLDIAVTELEKEHSGARRQLAMLACFHGGDISDAVINAVCGDTGSQMAVAAAQLGVFSLKWEDSAFAIHPTIGAVLRKDLSREELTEAAAALKSMWPRRWRGMGSHLAYNLVWHTHALAAHFAERSVPYTADLMDSMDRSAVFLAHSEARDLAIAAHLWHAVFRQHQKEATPSAETVRIARECGRLLHFLRDERAEGVLQAAHTSAVAVHGPDAVETALILGCLAPYLEASQTSLDTVARAVELLEARIASVDLVLSKEETKMLLETVFVLIVCRGQMMGEMGHPVPDSLWAALDSVKDRLRPLQARR